MIKTTILYNRIPDIDRRGRVFKIALLIAVLLNLDKIVLGYFSFIRVYDSFDGCLSFATSFSNNLLRFGFVFQSPDCLCGISNFTYPIALGYVLTQLILPPYINYLFHSIFVIFIAFLGMFLFLHDEFKLREEASYIGALFFSSITIFLPSGIGFIGIPLLIWSYERVFDDSYSFKLKLIAYFYILVYFLSGIFAMTAFFLIPFYLSYFLTLSKIKKNPRNTIILCLIWGLYVLINLPQLAELLFHAPASHRMGWYNYNVSISWINAARVLLEKVFYVNMHDWYISMPSLLGLLIVIYYAISVKEIYKDKNFLFTILWIIFVEILVFFINWSPIWEAVRKRLGFLNTFHIEYMYFLLTILFATLIGLASNFFISREKPLDKKRWIIALIFTLLYLFLNFRYHSGLKLQVIIQLLSLGIFLMLMVLKLTKKKNLSPFFILLIPFSFFSITNTIDSRIYFGFDTDTYNHFFNSEQIEKVKNLERNNLDNFRVVKVGGYHPFQLLQNGFQCADAYASLYPQSYKEFWAKVIEPVLSESKRYQSYFSRGGSNRVYLFDDINQGEVINKLSFNPELLKLINVKYLFSEKEILKYEKYDLVKVAEKDPNYIKLPKWKKYFMKGEFFVYQNKDFAPQIFLTDLIKAFDNKQDLLDELGREDYAYLKEHTFVLKESMPSTFLEKFDLRGSKILNYRLTPDYVCVQLYNKYPVILNWTRNYNKNWSCKIDGKDSKIFVIYNSFIGTIVPAHSHIVELRYRNIYLHFSYIISILGSIVISIFVIRYCKNNSPA